MPVSTWYVTNCSKYTCPESLPDTESLGLTIYHALEVPPSLLINAVRLNLLDLVLLLRCVLALLFELRDLGLESLDLLSLFVLYVADLDVDVVQVTNRVLDELFFAAVEIETNSQHTVLLSPVSEVVHTNDVPSRTFV